MKTVILHIGRQKTGTTSIQSMLTDNRALLSKYGIWYPDTGRGKKRAHHELSSRLNPEQSDNNAYSETRNAFMHELSERPEPLVVVSSEGMQNIKDLSRVSDLFSRYKLEVVCYLRESLAWKQSAYAQLVHAQRYTGKFYDYAMQATPDYRAFCTRWQAVTSEFQERLFERNHLHNGDVVSDFLSHLGPQFDEQDMATLTCQQENPSLGGNLLYFKLLMNLAHENKPEFFGQYNALGRLAASEPRWRQRWYVSVEDARQIRRVDRDSNNYLRNRFGDVKEVDTSRFPPMPDQVTLKEDIAIILSDPSLTDAFLPLGLVPTS